MHRSLAHFDALLLLLLLSLPLAARRLCRSIDLCSFEFAAGSDSQSRSYRVKDGGSVWRRKGRKRDVAEFQAVWLRERWRSLRTKLAGLGWHCSRIAKWIAAARHRLLRAASGGACVCARVCAFAKVLSLVLIVRPLLPLMGVNFPSCVVRWCWNKPTRPDSARRALGLRAIEVIKRPFSHAAQDESFFHRGCRRSGSRHDFACRGRPSNFCNAPAKEATDVQSCYWRKQLGISE